MSDPNKRTVASIQKEIDAGMFAQRPLHIIERYLESFATDGSMSFPVPEHILESLAVHFRAFLAADSELLSLDEAFGGSVARQRQARAASDLQYRVAFAVHLEREQLRKMTLAERGHGTPHEIACERVADQFGMSADNVRRLYKASKPKRTKRSG